MAQRRNPARGVANDDPDPAEAGAAAAPLLDALRAAMAEQFRLIQEQIAVQIQEAIRDARDGAQQLGAAALAGGGQGLNQPNNEVVAGDAADIPGAALQAGAVGLGGARVHEDLVPANFDTELAFLRQWLERLTLLLSGSVRHGMPSIPDAFALRRHPMDRRGSGRCG